MKFNKIFSSGMVFAKEQPIRIYGSGAGNAEVTFASVTKKAAVQNGKWYAEFPAMEYGEPYELVLNADGVKTVLNDIYVGDVYLFAGQSNMQFKIKEGTDAPELCETNEMLRLFSPYRMEEGDFYTPEHGWVKAEKSMAREWSAIAHFAGLRLQKKTGAAVGIIVSYQGASVIESWMPKGLTEQNGIFVPLGEKSASHRIPEYSAWNADGALYEYMLKQVMPFSLSGVVWYQGESDASFAEAKVYCRELKILIDAWRQDFCRPDLPFVIVQIADFDGQNDEAWRLVQKAQYDVQFAAQNVTTVISADVSASDNIHPPKKYELSQRIAAALLNF